MVVLRSKNDDVRQDETETNEDMLGSMESSPVCYTLKVARQPLTRVQRKISLIDLIQHVYVNEE